MIVLEATALEQIVSIGVERKPAEACGVLLPTPYRGRQVWEMPNRSKTPQDSFELHTDDVVVELEEWIKHPSNERFWNEVCFWHTHPKGNLGPSKFDIQHRLPGGRNLVVSLSEGNAKATWY